MGIKIRPYKIFSDGASKLRDALEEVTGRKVWITNKTAWNRPHTIINWGHGGEFLRARHKVLNIPTLVSLCINKLTTLTTLVGLVPEFTTSKAQAERWTNEGHKVYCRTTITGSEGRGIVVASAPNEVVRAPLYTKRFKHTREYRVHVFDREVIQVVQKKKRNGTDPNPLVRSNDDWVFARNLDKALDSQEVQKVKEIAISGAARLGILFGAFDILYSVKQDKAVILECNTAPGLDKTSAKCYAEAFKRYLNL